MAANTKSGSHVSADEDEEPLAGQLERAAREMRAAKNLEERSAKDDREVFSHG